MTADWMKLGCICLLFTSHPPTTTDVPSARVFPSFSQAISQTNTAHKSTLDWRNPYIPSSQQTSSFALLLKLPHPRPLER